MRRAFQSATKGCRSHVGQQIRIVSYNILADKYCGYNSYCPPQFLNWGYRCPRLLFELESYQPDLLCLQEVEQTVYDQQLQPWMSQHGYSSLYQPRRSPAEQVSLHYKASIFSLLASSAVRFADDSAAAVLPSSCCHRHSHSRFLTTLRQREEGCIMALLLHQPSQQQLLVCSTHLFWNPLFPDVKVAQAAIMCASIAAFLQQHGRSAQHVPVAIGGDFNSLWQKYNSDQWDQVPAGQALQSGVYQLMQQGQLTPSHRDHPANRTCSNCSSSSSRGGSSRRAQRAQRAQQQQQQRQPAFAGGGWQQQRQQLLQQGFGLEPELWAGSSSADSSMDDACDSPAGSRDSGGAGGGSRSGSNSSSSGLVDHMFTTAGLQLDSSYQMAHGREPLLTTRTATFSGTLDYIWLSKQHWQVSATLAMPYAEPQQPCPPEAVTSLGPCPNELMPSDHFAIGCDAVLLPVAR